MQPQHQNLAQVEESDLMSKNNLKQSKTITPRKSQRQIKEPERYGFDNIMSYALQIVEEINSFEPTTYQEAISYFEVEEWMMAMNKKMESLLKNQTWDLVELSKGR